MDAVTVEASTGASAGTVRAAGGVLWRTRPVEQAPARCEVALVHRPRYDDWTLPKGKLQPGEHPMVAACREVLEETGVQPRVGPRLQSAHYRVPFRRARPDLSVNAGLSVPKVVDFWAMRVVADRGFVPSDETDALEWLPLDIARTTLSYPRDVAILTSFERMAAVGSPLVVIASGASAIDRADVWACFDPVRVVSSPRADRSIHTLTALLGIGVESDPELSASLPAQAIADHLVALVSDDSSRAQQGATLVCASARALSQAVALLTNRSGRGELQIGVLERSSRTGLALFFGATGLAVVDNIPA